MVSRALTALTIGGRVSILIGCEESGTVRDALIRRGHDAWSCDILPSRGEYTEKHIQGDIMEILYDPRWNALIAFPDCTFMANSGAKHLYNNQDKTQGINRDRLNKMVRAAMFFKTLLDAPIEKIALENPQMLGYAMDIIGKKQTQIIQPWQFGHPETKKTYLWLKGFPELEPTNIVEGREQRIWKMPPGPNRKRERSKTYKGIADAMAEQWF